MTKPAPRADVAKSAAKLVVDGELQLYGSVGVSFWDEDNSFSAREVKEALSTMSGDLVVRVNSGGGVAWDGIAIHNSLVAYKAKHKANVTIHVDGIAASAASVIAMAGDEIVCPANASIMIHNAATYAYGNKAEVEKTLVMLAQLDGQMVDLYVERTGQDRDAVVKMMDAETWLTGKQAVETGFATKTTESASVTLEPFAYHLYRHAPEAVMAANKALPIVPPSIASPSIASPAASAADIAAAAPAATSDPEISMPDKNPAAANAVDVKAASDAAAVQARKDEKQRQADIRAAVRAAKLDPSVADELIEKDVSANDARADVLARLAAADTHETRSAHRVSVGADARDKFSAGVTKALLARAGFDAKAGAERNEFNGLTLREIARMSLEQAGIKASGNDTLQMIRLAMSPVMSGGMHSTSDFVQILENIANKSMLKGYGEADETFDIWTARGSLGDFKIQKRVDAGLFPNLAAVPEGGEYSYATISERGESIMLATYGKKFSITRQAIINDDMSVFTKIPTAMGRAAKRTIGNMVYAILTSNPAMSDSVALFHADHKNLLTAAALSVASLSDARAKMALQKDADGIATALNLKPKYLLVPVALETTANVLMASEFDPSKTQRTPNPMRGTSTVVSDARLDANSSTAWYTAADPNATDTVEVAYLDGNSTPFLDNQMGWDVDGVEYKVRIDAGVKALGWRGMQKNAGA